MNNVISDGDRWLFFEVLTHSPDLKHLNLSGTTLFHNDVKLLCNALNNPVCNVEELLWVSVLPGITDLILEGTIYFLFLSTVIPCSIIDTQT